MVSRRACLHADHTRRNFPEELDHLAASKLPRKHDAPLTIDAMNLEHSLRQVQTDRRRLHVNYPSCDSFFNDHATASRCRERASSTSSELDADEGALLRAV
jgi:hypothetical protein